MNLTAMQDHLDALREAPLTAEGDKLDPHAETLATFARLFPPNPYKHGRVLSRDAQTGEKRVDTREGQPVQLQFLKSNLGIGGKLAGNALGYLPGGEDSTSVGAIDLDGKNFPDGGIDEAKRTVLETCVGLNLNAYAERSSSGKGWHVWLWSTEPLAYAAMCSALRAITRRAGIPKAETYPMGTKGAKGRWIITPYYGALKKDPPHLGKTYLENDDGQPIPVDELEDWITPNPAQALQALAAEEAAHAHPAQAERLEAASGGEFLPEAVEVLLVAARAHAPAARHDALAAFLNLGLRAGNLAGMVEGLKEEEVFLKWCADGSRTAHSWAEEINRWAESVESGEEENRRGLPYLKEAGFSIPDLPRRSGLTWGERQELPPILPPAPAMPPEMLPAVLRGWLVDVAEPACVPLEGVAASAVVGLSGLIGRSVQLDPEGLGDWYVTPNLWGALVMRPSGLKSMQLGRALEPLQELENRARVEFEEGKLDREVRLESLKAQEEQLKKESRKPGRALDVDALRELRAEARETAPAPRRYMIKDTTHEKLGELLRENPRGLTLVKDELGGWIEAMSREENAEARAFWLSSWNGDGSHDFDRIGRGTVRVDNLCVAVAGVIQPGPLQRFVQRSRAGGAGDVGFLQRFQLLIYPDGLPAWVRRARKVDAQARAQAFAVYEALGTLREMEEAVTLTFSEEAQPVFSEWRDALERRLRSVELVGFPAFESHLGKYRSLVPSLALVFHLVDVAAQGGNLQRLPPVSIDALELALNWAEYLELHARKVYALELGTSYAPAHELAGKIKGGAVKDGDRLRDLRRKEWSGLKDDALGLGIDALTRLGWVQVEEVETGGRPSEVLRLHPDLIGGPA